MAQPLVELKEPLISTETKNNLHDAFLRSYHGIFSKNSQDQDEHHDENEYQASNADHAQEQKEQSDRYVHKLTDFKEDNENKKVIETTFYNQPHLKKFYHQATAAHEFPGLTIEKVCYQQSNPGIFAVISRASDLFKSIDVQEFMGFEDYKKLTRIRIRNYVNILRMITRVDQSEPTYAEVKLKLFQVKKLTEYLNIKGFDKIYTRLLKNLQIYDLDEAIPEDHQSEHNKAEEPPKEEEEKKSEKSEHESEHEDGEENEEKSEKDEEAEDGEKSLKSGSQKDSEKEGSDEDSDEDEEEESEEEEIENEEDQEYEDFYKFSDLSNGDRGRFTQELEREELKWVKRAEWLEQAIAKLNSNEQTQKWVPWFQAKLDQLADLDVPIKNVSENSSPQVFYFYKYIDDMITKFNPEQDYHKDQRVYPEEQNQYPKVKVDINYSMNEASASLKAWTSIREKLCRRVNRRESETDYFITVFEKKPFGNEKIYEKRLNLRGKTFSKIDNFELHPQGEYLYLEFAIQGGSEHVFRLVFSLNAQFKDPLFIKKDSRFHSFQDKYLYMIQSITQKKDKFKKEEEKTKTPGDEEAAKDDEIQLVVEGAEEEKTKGEDKVDEEKAESEKKESENDDESAQDGWVNGEYIYETFERVFEYDLNDFNKVKTVDFKNMGAGDLYNDEHQEQFVKYRNGFLFLRKKYLDPENKFFNYEIHFKNDLLKMDSSEKFDEASEAEVNINEKCDRLLITYWKDGILILQRYNIEFREKKIKKGEEIKMKQDQVVIENGKIEMKVVPMFTDFLLLFKVTKGKKVFVFQNENFITSVESDIDHLSFYHSQEKGLHHIIIIEKNQFDDLAQKNNIRYQICQSFGDKDKKEVVWKWSIVNHEIYNRQDEVCFPYAYTIYNHDQVYMKDLTKFDLQGFYYMNSFLGIDQGFRPLTIHSVAYSNKLNLSIPTINSNYTGNDFLIKIHQIKSCYEQTTMFRFAGLVRFRVYTYNQDILGILSQWSGLTDTKNRLHSDIKIQSKYHSMNVEQWEKGKCIQRLVVTHFHYSRRQYDLDVASVDTTLEYKPQGCWCIVTQKQEGQSSIIEVYTREMRYSFKFPELLSLKSIWDYTDDDSGSNIYGIYVDTLVKDKLDLYILYSNCQMRKFSTHIYNSELQFDEHSHIFNLESHFKNLVKEQSDAATSKKTNLYEHYKGDIFIANSVFYSQQCCIDLSTPTYQDKYQVGNVITSHLFKQMSKISKFTYSHNEAKLAAFYKSQDLRSYYGADDYSAYGRNGYILIIMPIYNARQLPLFQHRQFRHPVVPIVDKDKGCTAVFTLQLGTLYTDPWSTSFNTHAHLRKRLFNKWMNLNPGLIIKYFNGIEEKVPLNLFGEDFTEIIRFQQSRDGKLILLVGTRKGVLQDRFYDQKLIEGLKEQKGMFLYRISVNSVQLVKAFLFAEKSPKTIDSQLLEAFKLPSLKGIEQIPPEIQGYIIGEYQNDYLDNDGRHDYQSYQSEIQFKEFDEFYVDELKRQKEEQERLKRMEEEAKLKKSGVHNRSIAKKNTLLDSIGGEDDEEHHKHENDQDKQDGDKKDEEFKVIPRLDDLQPLFPGFDIPYLGQKSDWQIQFEQIMRDNLLLREYDNPVQTQKPETVNQFTYEYEKENKVLFSEEQLTKIRQIHENMHLEINELGHIFLINRLCNKLYFFYECHGEHKVTVLKFEPEFVIETADSTLKYLVVTAKEREEGQSDKHRFRILNIQDMINCDVHTKTFEMNDLKVVYDSKNQENMEVKKEVLELDEYNYEIKDCKIVGDFLILKIYDNSYISYLKVVDLNKRIITYYIEGNQFAISGDKKYIWIMENNQVYDIVNGLSTFFIWPGDQINTHAYSHMDIFNVNEDRTLMVTQGYIQLAFNLFSFIIDEDTNSGYYKNESNFHYHTHSLNYLCYKIGHHKSQLEYTFYQDYDKLTPKKFIYDSDDADDRAPLNDKDRFDLEVSQNKQISNLLGYISTFYNSETADPAHISNFFLSYYFISKDPNTKETKYMNIFERMFAMQFDKRGDLIEDILNYVVHCTTVPITQSVINTCFAKFLLNANSSQSFQYYLNNITLQSSKMKEIEKFQIASTELGFIVESYDSPIMDDRFYSKFKNIKESKRDTEISYIHLGTLLADHGQEIMEMLSDKKYLSIMDIPFIRYLVMYQWFNIKSTIHKKLLLPFMILLILFTLYTTTIDFYSYPDDYVPEENYPLYIANWINSILLLAVLGYFIRVEARQFVKVGREYFSDFWNISDLLNYFMCLIVIIFDLTSVPSSINRPIASLCLIILWIKMFYFLRVFETTSKLIRMIIEIVNDMKNFLIVLLIGIVGFSGGFFILQQAVPFDEVAERKDPEEANQLVIGNYILSLIYTYRLAQGDFQLDFFDQLSGADYVLAWFLFIFGSLFLVIVLLNLLIAIMGDTFSRVLESITNLTVREKVMLVSENESLFSREELFKSAQFLIVITEKNLDSVQAENWDGQINALKRQVLDKVGALETNLDTKITENQKDLKKKIMEQEDRAKKQAAMQEQRIQSTVKTEFVDAFVKINEQFNLQQQTMKTQQHLASEQMRAMRALQDQIEQLRNDQSRLSQFVQKAVGSKGNDSDDSDEE